MGKIKDDDELKFEYKTSSDRKLYILKVTAPHELNDVDFIWALEYFADLLKEQQRAKLQWPVHEV